jgi:HK97 family phage major capsid protein
MLSTEQLLRKALAVTDGNAGAHLTGSGADFGGAGQAPLSVEQVTAFIELMAASQTMLPDVRRVTSSSAKWQESIIDFGARIARPGIEATRLSGTGDYTRAKPATGIVEISTVLLRAEVPVSDEVFEDNVAGGGLVNSIERLIADRFGYDIEELLINGDTGSGDAYLALLDGWLAQAQADGTAIDGSTYGKDYQEIFRVLLNSLDDRFKRQLESDWRFYLPQRTVEQYRDLLSSRGTPLGDLMLTGTGELRYQGILIKGVPNFAVTADASSILLAHRSNLYAGFHRAMKMETYRDPREGATSFVVTARVDAQVAVPEATVIAYDVDVSV